MRGKYWLLPAGAGVGAGVLTGVGWPGIGAIVVCMLGAGVGTVTGLL